MKKPKTRKPRPRAGPEVYMQSDIVVLDFGDAVFTETESWEASMPRIRIGLTVKMASQLKSALAKPWAESREGGQP